ncbi:MAG: hypothetical protein LAO24_03665 [Acidobacteriia bacterium]|nr:hypothetical protein [Terriglobia bacterium]
MTNKIHLAVLIFTFSSGFGGLGYQQFASQMCWPVGASWGTRKMDILCGAAMVLAVAEAWGGYGVLKGLLVVLIGALLAFATTVVFRGFVQVLNLLGITVGTVCSFLGSSVFRA